MPTRPTWSSSLQICLVSIAVKLFPARTPKIKSNSTRLTRRRISTFITEMLMRAATWKRLTW